MTIPKLRPPHETPPITDLTSLTDHWRALMGPLGFSYRRLSMSASAATLDVSMWPMHFANDVELRVFAPDDLLG